MPPSNSQGLAAAIEEYNKERRLSGLPEMANPTIVMKEGQAPVIEDRPVRGASVAAPVKEAPVQEEQPQYKSPARIQAERDYAAELAGAEEDGVDTSAYPPAPKPTAMPPIDGPSPLDIPENLAGGRIGTSVGKTPPTSKSRFLYQNLSNDPARGVRKLREDNPGLDFQYSPRSGPVYRNKLPDGQTESPDEWHPIDPYGNPVVHPIDFVNKFGVVGGAKEIYDDVTDEVANLVSGAYQTGATVAGGLAGALPGAMAASAASGATANTAKQALGVLSGYGDASATELGLTTILSAIVPAIFGSGASKAEIADFTAKKIAALKAGVTGAWDWVTKLLTEKNLPGMADVAPKGLDEFSTQASNILRNGGLEPTKELVANKAKELLQADTTQRLGQAVQPHLNTVTDLISGGQRGLPKRVWDAVTPQSSVSADVIKWAKEKVSPEYIQRMASEAGIAINEKLDMTRRRLADFLKSTDIGQAVHRSATTAIDDIRTSLGERYTSALAGVKELQNWGDVRKRYHEAMSSIIDGGAVNEAEADLHKKAVEFGDHTLVLKNRNAGSAGSQTGSVDLAAQALSDMGADRRLGAEGGTISDVVHSFIGREIDTLKGYSSNLEYDFKDMLDRYKAFVMQHIPAPSRQHTTSTEQMYHKAMAIGDSHLTLFDPELPASQLGPANKLFEHLNNLSAAVNDAKLSNPGVIGVLARKLDNFIEAEKAKLYELIDDKALKSDWKRFVNSVDGLEKKFAQYFSDPVKASGTIDKALEAGARPADVKRVVADIDHWTRSIDLSNVVAPRPTLSDYVKQAAVGEAVFPQAASRSSRDGYVAGKLFQGPAAAAPGLLEKASSYLRGPKGLNMSLRLGESPTYQAIARSKDAAVNATSKIPFKPVNRWMLLNTEKDKNYNKQEK